MRTLGGELFLNDFRLRGERVCLQAGFGFARWFVNFVVKLIFAFAASVLKAFGVAEALSLLAKKVPKETSPGIARKPAKKFVCQGAVVTRVPLPSARSDIRRLKTLANDFLTARFTGPKAQKQEHLTRSAGILWPLSAGSDICVWLSHN